MLMLTDTAYKDILSNEQLENEIRETHARFINDARIGPVCKKI